MKFPKILEQHREYLESTYRPANEITFLLEETKPWESKLGGCPYLEDAKTYPKATDNKPMMFLAQINFDEMEPLPDFPKTGILQFFVEDNDLYGLYKPCVVKYIPTYTKDTTTLLAENPYTPENDEPFDRSGKITFMQKIMPISLDCREFQSKFYDKVSEEEWDGLYAFCQASGSRVGGYPSFVQSMLTTHEDGIDVLLLQLNFEDVCDIHFGDAAYCNFLISKEALLRRDFSDIMYDYQCG